jgi:trigger factor
VSRARSFPGQEAEVIKFYQSNPDLLKPLSSNVLENKSTQNILDKEVEIIEKKYSKKDLEKLLNEESL